LNFVFGEARCPGKAALISLHRLRPEFDGRKPNDELLIERTEKEAVHELGHTLGLRHCANPFCVMHFSNSIFDTDRKQSLFCSKCQTKIEGLIDAAGEETWTTRSKPE
jgi:archaemetzincin